MAQFQKKLIIPEEKYFNVAKILQLNGAKVRVVGGAVRDALLNNFPSDVDLAVDTTPQESFSILEKSGIKCIKTGIKYGTITAINNNSPVEITSLREDILTDGRHAVVKYCKDFEKDALRRDFTINAMSYCPFENIIYDYFDGARDLENKIVRFIGTPKKRITEDYLRILRFFRFSSRFSNIENLDRPSLEACIEFAPQISLIAKERVRQELMLILETKPYIDFLSLMTKHKILAPCFNGELQNNTKFLQDAENFGTKISYSLTSIAKIAALLSFNYKEEDLKLDKFSNKELKHITSLLNIVNIKEEKKLICALKACWHQDIYFPEVFCFAAARFRDILPRIGDLYQEISKHKSKPSFPLKAIDLQEIGIADKMLGKYLKNYYDIWLNSNFKLTTEEMLIEIKKDAKK